MATMFGAAILGFVGFNVAMFMHMCAPPPHLWDPQGTKYLGKLWYLTYQTNLIGCIYFGASIVGGQFLQTWLYHLFPLMFTLGVFLTVSYYGLEHFNKEAADNIF